MAVPSTIDNVKNLRQDVENFAIAEKEMEEQLAELESALTKLKCSADPRDRALTVGCNGKLERAKRKARMFRKGERHSWSGEELSLSLKRVDRLTSLGESLDEDEENVFPQSEDNRCRLYSMNDAVGGGSNLCAMSQWPKTALPAELLLKDRSAFMDEEDKGEEDDKARSADPTKLGLKHPLGKKEVAQI